MFARRICTTALVVFAAAMAEGSLATSPGAGEVADSPEQVRPALIGARVPELTLENDQGGDFDLGAAIARQPTILILYRGGW